MEIKVYDNGEETADRYTVVLGSEMHLMSEDANMPNGICMFLGQYRPKDKGQLGAQKTLGQMPKGVLLQIIHLLAFELHHREG